MANENQPPASLNEALERANAIWGNSKPWQPNKRLGKLSASQVCAMAREASNSWDFDAFAESRGKEAADSFRAKLNQIADGKDMAGVAAVCEQSKTWTEGDKWERLDQLVRGWV